MPKTGVFGLYDLIGIDLMSDVARSLVSILPPDDPFHAVSAEIPLMARMIEEGYTGNKSLRKAGFTVLRTLRTAQPGKPLEFDNFNIPCFRPQQDLKWYLRLNWRVISPCCWSVSDRIGQYAWEILSSTLCYAAALVPAVNESLVAIDDAMKLGYNWLQGPFEMLDQLGRRYIH